MKIVFGTLKNPGAVGTIPHGELRAPPKANRFNNSPFGLKISM